LFLSSGISCVPFSTHHSLSIDELAKQFIRRFFSIDIYLLFLKFSLCHCRIEVNLLQCVQCCSLILFEYFANTSRYLSTVCQSVSQSVSRIFMVCRTVYFICVVHLCYVLFGMFALGLVTSSTCVISYLACCYILPGMFALWVVTVNANAKTAIELRNALQHRL